MNNLCVIAYVRSSCENFISQIAFDRLIFNSFDVFYNKPYIINFPTHQHVIKIYAETLANEYIQSLLYSMKNYDFIYFKRSNIKKNFMTKKMQDNLVGEYGKDYNTFKIEFTEFDDYVRQTEYHHQNFIKLFKKEYFHYDPDKYNFIIPDQLISKKYFINNTFYDAFEENLCKKFILNYKEF